MSIYSYSTNLNEAAVEDHDLVVLLLSEGQQVSRPLPAQVHLVQHPLGTVRTLPEVASHGSATMWDY